jgi:hypothetical protein
MDADHTEGVPPNQGKITRLMRGCTWKSRNADREIVIEKVSIPLREWCCAFSGVVLSMKDSLPLLAAAVSKKI